MMWPTNGRLTCAVTALLYFRLMQFRLTFATRSFVPVYFYDMYYIGCCYLTRIYMFVVVIPLDRQIGSLRRR